MLLVLNLYLLLVINLNMLLVINLYELYQLDMCVIIIVLWCTSNKRLQTVFYCFLL